MKIQLCILLLIFCMNLAAQTINNPLSKCPKSPNCFRSESPANNKNKKPFAIIGAYEQSKVAFENMILKIPSTKLIDSSKEALKFHFTTKLGKFTDEVSFFFDKENNCIHFRSASLVGWSDMGANKRRIKKIRKEWNLMMDTKRQ